MSRLIFVSLIIFLSSIFLSTTTDDTDTRHKVDELRRVAMNQTGDAANGKRLAGRWLRAHADFSKRQNTQSDLDSGIRSKNTPIFPEFGGLFSLEYPAPFRGSNGREAGMFNAVLPAR